MGGPPFQASVFLTDLLGGRRWEMVFAVVNGAVFLCIVSMRCSSGLAKQRSYGRTGLTAADPVVAPDRR